MTKPLLLGVAVAVPVADCGVCWIVDFGVLSLGFRFWSPCFLVPVSTTTTIIYSIRTTQ
jgi:hypothetical protein